MSEGKDPRPSGTGEVYGGLTPYLMMKDARAAADFYVETFGATRVGEPHLDDKGRVLNLQLTVNGSTMMLMDPMEDYGFPFKDFQGFTLHMQVEDGAKELYDRAIAAGCTANMPFGPQFWGDNYGQFTDPFGVAWSVGQKA